MTGAVLWMIGRLGWLLSLLGFDRRQFEAILRVKLTLDDRRSLSGLYGPGKKANRALLLTFVFYTLLGVIVGSCLLFVESALASMTIFFTFLMTMVSMSLIADFTTVLFDTADNTILLARPVDSRTILAARIAHVSVYLVIHSLGLAACTFVTGTIAVHPLFAPLFAVMLVFALCVVVFFVHLFYLVAMRLFDVERFRDIIVYFQIALSLSVFAAFQVLPRLVDMSDVDALRIDDSWLVWIWPPAWMAAPFDLLAGQIGPLQITLTVAAAVVPITGVILVVRVLAPGFTRALARVEQEKAELPRRARAASRNDHRSARLPRLKGPDREERALFDLIRSLLARDRAFKLATYPSFAIMLFVACHPLYAGTEGFAETLKNLPETKNHLFALYCPCVLVPTALFQVRYSKQYQAAWLYAALPLARPGAIVMATLKAVMFRLVAPFYGIVAVVVLAVWGLAVLPDLILAGTVLILFSFICTHSLGWRLPFSQQRLAREAGGQAVKMILFMILALIVGAAHHGLTFITFGVTAASILAAMLCVLLYRGVSRRSWQVPFAAAAEM